MGKSIGGNKLLLWDYIGVIQMGYFGWEVLYRGYGGIKHSKN